MSNFEQPNTVDSTKPINDNSPEYKKEFELYIHSIE